VVKIWQNRELGEFAPAWDPGTRHSPNTLFAAAMAQGGFALHIPAPELYYELLPCHHVMIHGRRGVKIKELWYDGPALDPYRDSPSTRGGKQHKGRWVIRRDPRDRRFTYFQDPLTHHWHTLRWAGLPPDGEVPSFGDARVEELLREAKRRGLKPKSDAELLPLLLELVGGHIPVAAWPTQMPRAKRKDHAREVLQGRAAAADRPSAATAASAAARDEAAAVPLGWMERAAEAVQAIDDERRRRREQAVPERPLPPRRLGEAIRRRGIFAVPDEDDSASVTVASAEEAE
jgi:hypothetical protein